MQALGMLPVLIILAIAFHYSQRAAVPDRRRTCRSCAAGGDQHRARRRHDLRDPDRRHRPLGRLDPRRLGDGRADRLARLRTGAGSACPPALLTGLVFGLLNGGLIAFGKLPPFIVTLGSLTAVRGIARLMGARHHRLQPGPALRLRSATRPSRSRPASASRCWRSSPSW